MKIAKRIKINTAIFLSMIVIFSAVILLFSSFLYKAENNSALVENTIIEVKNLRTVTFEYFLNYEDVERPAKQWPIIAEALSASLKQIKPASLDEKELVGRMLDEASGIREMISVLISLHKEFGNSHEKAAAAEADIRAQLLARLENVRTDAALLNRTIAKRQETARTRAFGLIMLFIISMLGLVGYNEFALKKAVGLPLGKLRDTMEVVAKGHLEHKIGISSDDEIGELATAFDRMTEELKKVTASYDELDLILRASMDGYFVSDTKGRILYVNDSFCKMLGFSRDELLNMNITEIEASETSAETARHTEKVMQEGSDNFETRHRCKDGRIVALEVSVNYLNIKGGQFYVFLRDITERKKWEENLEASEERYRRLFETTKDGLLLLNKETERIFRANPAAHELLGYTHEEFAGKKLSDIGIFINEDELEKAFRSLREKGCVHCDAKQIETKDRGAIIADIMLVDRSDIVQCNIRDFTERRKAEEFIKGILQNVDEGFVVIDAEYKIISANRAYLEQQKSGLEEVIGRHCYEVSHHTGKPCYMEGEECAPMHTFKTGEPYAAVHTHYDKAGSPIYIETKSFPMRDVSGKVFAVIETLNNITEKRKLEEQLRHAQKMEAIGTLASGIAHDFNNILTAIIGYGYTLNMKMKEDDPLKTHIESILASADRAANLTQSLLAFSRKQIINLMAVDLNEVVKRTEKFLSRVIGEDIELKTILAEKDLTVMADSGQMEQVLMNLATNARDAMPGGGLLSIATDIINIDKEYIKAHGYGEEGDYAVISVTDTGKGMDENTRQKIFEPFFTTKEVGKGTGLGLSVVYGIVKQHNGYINCYSEQGTGTTFKIYLPLIKKVEEHKEKAIAGADEVRGGTETILLAEDEIEVRKIIKSTLEEFGYKVIEANDGEDAIEKFKGNKDSIHLLFFDVVMPKMSGKEAYERIKRIKPDVKVLFASGYPSDFIHREEMLKEGYAFIAKPVSPMVTLKKIREVLDK